MRTVGIWSRACSRLSPSGNGRYWATRRYSCTLLVYGAPAHTLPSALLDTRGQTPPDKVVSHSVVWPVAGIRDLIGVVTSACRRKPDIGGKLWIVRGS